MSALRKLELPEIKNVEALRSALGLMNKIVATKLQTNTTRRGFAAYREQHNCALVLPREVFSGVEDIAWCSTPAGTLEVIYDVDDTRKLDKAFGINDFFGAVPQYYTAAVAKKELELAGYTCEVAKEKDGTLQVVATNWA
jgi:hypothetical protein